MFVCSILQVKNSLPILGACQKYSIKSILISNFLLGDFSWQKREGIYKFKFKNIPFNSLYDFLNWTPKNISDRQQCVGFRKAEKC